MKIICSAETLSQDEFDSKFGVALRKMCTRSHQSVEISLLEGLSVGFISTVEGESFASISYKGDDRVVLLFGYPVFINGDEATVIQKNLNADIEELIQAIIKGLDGAFCVFIKEKSGSIYIVTDLLGLFPFYKNNPTDGASVVFSTEMKGVSAVRGENQLCPEAFAEWVTVGATSGSSSLVRGVSRLSNAHVYQYDPVGNELLVKEAYWTYCRGGVKDFSDTTVEAVYENLRDETLSTAKKFERHAISLSGGFDSRLIAAILASENIPLESVSVRHSDEHGDLDGYLSGRVADRLNIKHRKISPDKDFFSYDKYYSYQNESELSNPGLSMFIAAVTQSLSSVSQSMWNGLCVGSAFKLAHSPSYDFESYFKNMVRGGSIAKYLSGFLMFFKPEYAEAIQHKGHNLISDLSDKYGNDIDGIASFIEDGRIRHRVAMNPIKVMANYMCPLTPGLGKAFRASLDKVPTHLRFSGEIHEAILARYFPELYKIPVVSGSKVYQMGGADFWSRAQIKYRCDFLAHWRIKKLLGKSPKKATFNPFTSQLNSDALDQATYAFGLRDGFFSETSNLRKAKYQELLSYAVTFDSTFNS